MQWISIVATWLSVAAILLSLYNIRRAQRDLIKSRTELAEQSLRNAERYGRYMKMANIAILMRDELVTVQTQEDPVVRAYFRDPSDRGVRLGAAVKTLDKIMDEIMEEIGKGLML